MIGINVIAPMMEDRPIRIQVSCYSGYRGEEMPRQFVLWDQKREVVEIVDCWLAPSHRYFKIKADDSATYIIRHDCESLEWELTYFSKLDQ
jgi:hypothetical protein